MIRKIKRKILKCSLKRQMIVLFLPLTLLFVLAIGIFSYSFEVNQVQKNALYLINNTVLQTSNILNERMSEIFTQVSQISDSTSVSNLFINDYSPSVLNQKYNDILDTYNNMNRVYDTYNDIVDSLYLKTSSDTEISVYKDLEPAVTSVDLNQWIRTYPTSQTGFYWQNIHADKVFQTQPPRKVLSLIKIVGNRTSNARMLLVCNLKPDYFIRTVENAQISKHGYMIIASKDAVLYPQKQEDSYRLTGEEVAQMQKASSQSGMKHLKSTEGKELLVDYRPLMNNQWVVAAVVPVSDLTETFSGLRYLLVVLILVLAVCFAALCLRFAATISKPIEQLSQKVSDWQNGDANVDFSTDYQSENEINTLSRGLYSLKNTVTDLLRQVKLEQKQKYKMELLAMQAQIKPHFLYNTLASVRNLVDMGDNRKAGVMCDALEKYYRIGVSNGKEVITVRQEVEHATNYLRIQQMRYQKDFDFFVNVDENIMNCDILKITLQPLVENAVYHGIKQKEGKGTIVLSGGRENGRIVFSVYDDGAGMSPEKLKELEASISGDWDSQSENFGLRNVSRRLRLFYGENAYIAFDSVKGMFTEVKVVIPCERGEESHEDSSPDDRR